MNIALGIIGLSVAAALLLGLLARRGVRMSLEQWSVGGRNFGGVLVFVLLAGEIYTTFTFLGASGFAYGNGGAAYYIICYTTLAFVYSYWLLPAIWRFAKANSLLTQPDFFNKKYESSGLGLIVALVGLVAMIPYLILQFKGLGIIVEAASYGSISTGTSVWIGAVIMTAYVVVSGVHGSAWIAAVKDVMILAVITFLGFYLPYHYYGGLGSMFAAIEAAKPGFLSLRPTGFSPVWYCSTILISGLGLYMWPHTFSSVFSAKSPSSFRSNSVVMPLYALVMLFAMIVGFAAVLKVPGLTGGQIDLALLRLSIQTFDPWFVGIIGAAGMLTALVPGSMMLIATSTLLAKNIYGKLDPRASQPAIGRAARLVAPAVTLVAVYFTLNGSTSIVALLIMGYSFVTQLFPSLVASLLPRRQVNKFGAGAGICVGVAIVVATVLTKTTMATLLPDAPSWIKDLNIGALALGLNFVTMLAVSQVTRRLAVAKEVMA